MSSTSEVTAAMDIAVEPPVTRIAGHPTGIFVLFLVEMWERFSYYGMRALLIFYLTQHFSLTDARAASMYGTYTALVYGASIAGGALSDRLLGQWRSIVLGGCLVLAGHLGLAIEGTLPAHDGAVPPLFFLSLGLIIAGTGLFKPSSTALVGGLYGSDTAQRRQTGYYVFYVGINLGSALAALVAGYLGQTYGWSFGFGAAAVGMALGLITLRLGWRHLKPYALTAAAPITWARQMALIVGFPVAAALLVQSPVAAGIGLLILFLAATLVLGRFVQREASPAQRSHVLAILVVLCVATFFWSLFEQAGSSLALFADRAVDLRAGSLVLRPSQTQFFNPAFILLGTPIIAALWAVLARRGVEPSTPWKLVLGLAQAALGFAVLVLGIHLTPPGEQVALAWLAAAYLLHTTGELCLSPTAMSELARLAPRSLSAMIMGLWLFSLAAGNYLGGVMAGWISTSAHAVEGSGLAAYADVFARVAGFAGALALVLTFGCGWLKRKMEAA